MVEPRRRSVPVEASEGPSIAMWADGRRGRHWEAGTGKNGSNRPALRRWRAAGLPAWTGAADRPRFGVISVRFAAIVDETGLSARHSTACGLLHSRSAFGIGLPLTASVRCHLGCGCSSVVEHDLAKVGVEGSSPFARSRFSSMANYRIDDRPPFGGLVVCAPAM